MMGNGIISEQAVLEVISGDSTESVVDLDADDTTLVVDGQAYLDIDDFLPHV